MLLYNLKMSGQKLRKDFICTHTHTSINTHTYSHTYVIAYTYIYIYTYVNTILYYVYV